MISPTDFWQNFTHFLVQQQSVCKPIWDERQLNLLHTSTKTVFHAPSVWFHKKTSDKILPNFLVQQQSVCERLIIFWDHLKNEDRLKNGDDLKNEDDLTNEVDSKVVLPKDGRSFQSSQCVDQICFSQHYSINIRLETPEIKFLSVAVLSQTKRSECGTVWGCHLNLLDV